MKYSDGGLVEGDNMSRVIYSDTKAGGLSVISTDDIVFVDAHLCRSYPFPGSIAMTAFLRAKRASLFSATFGSRWCSFMSLHTILYIYIYICATTGRHF